MRTIISLISIASLLGGCVTQLPYAEIKQPTPRYYVSAVDLLVGTESASIENQTETLATDAAKQLRKGITVAFQPPDACIDTSAKTGGGSGKDILRMQCGVRMANLERYVAKAGYNVVSWQGLKDAQKRPLEKAKALNVDVLFEVNQLAPGERTSGATKSTGLRFYEQTSSEDRRDLQVGQDVALRCKREIDKQITTSRARRREGTVTLDTKAVHVNSGRAIWYYQKTLRDASNDVERSATVDLYYESRPPVATPPQDPPPLNDKQRHGKVQMILAVIPAVVGLAIVGLGTAVLTSDQATGSLGPGLQGVGAGVMVFGSGFLLGIGGANLGKGNRMAREHNRQVSEWNPRGRSSTAEYPSTEAVLCASNPVTPPWLSAPVGSAAEGPAPAPPAPSTSSSYDFSETAQGSDDAAKRREDALIRIIAQDFVSELDRLTTAADSE